MAAGITTGFDPRRHLQARFALVFGGSGLIFAALLALAITWVGEREAEAVIGTGLAQTGRALARNMGDQLQERIDDMRMLSVLPTLRDPAMAPELGRGVLERMQESLPSYAWLGVTDAAGRVRIATGGLLEGVDVSPRPWFENGRRQPYLGDLHEAKLLAKHLGPGEGEPLRFVDIAIPQINTDGSLIGVVGAHLYSRWLGQLHERMHSERMRAQGIDLFFVDGGGKPLHSQAGGEEEIPAPFLGASERYLRSRWPDGREYLSAVAESRLPDGRPALGWRVLVRQDVERAFAPVRERRNQVLAIGFAGALAFALISWLLAGRIAAPIRLLAEGANRIRRGEMEDFPAPMGRRRDEVSELGEALRRLFAEQRAQAQQLAASEALFRDVAESLPFVVGLADEAGQCTYVNTRWTELTGQAPQDALGRGWDAVIHPDEQGRVAELYATTAPHGQPFSAEYRVRRRDGAWRWVLGMSVPRTRGKGSVGTLIDLTERVEAERALRTLNEELEQRVSERTGQLAQANRELETFAYSVSHDLKAPLRGIDGYSALLQDQCGDGLGEEGRVFVQNIRRGAQQMNALIEGLLAYSRMERRAMEPRPVEFSPLLSMSLAEFRDAVERCGTQVEIDVPGVAVRADHDGLAQALRNLIGNAIKFSAHARPPRVEIRAEIVGPALRVLVRDNGIGFDMRYYDRIFEIFQRLHLAEEYEGTGVGLALVRKAMERMGGRVWAESAPGAGASFFLEIPLWNPA
ncbi:ATP-binding protein [Niveibacterium sp. SC-1]|uniref:sensor histidine kinase n=1 Tax=Niveibacterium sp. SC-1 TaxID=3135646 RepID=UPI00311F2CBC